MNKHTPGPWKVEFHTNPSAMNEAGTHDIYGPKGIICCCEEADVQEQKANAFLIASAPEMLSCLENIFNKLESVDPDLRRMVDYVQLDAVLRRAKGIV